jgi:2-isopropylmalate synthase
VEFSALVQRHVDQSETEMPAPRLWALFDATYLAADETIVYHDHTLFESGARQGIELDVTLFGQRRRLRGIGNGPIDAAVNALGIQLRIDHYEERALAHGADASALAIVEAARDGVPGSRFGAGRHANIVTASVLAVLSAVRRLGIEAGDLIAPESRAG